MKLMSIVLSLVLLSGCVSMVVQKEVVVKKDANGNVTEIIESERATQQTTTMKGLKFDHLKIKATDTEPAAI